MAILDRSFFERKTLQVAHDLLGKFIVAKNGGRQISLMINEVEAYTGPHDLACHAARGKTLRTEVMFGPAGIFYVYFIYGIHWMLNIVTEREGYPSAVLIRGAGDVAGPARLTKMLGVNGAFNGLPAMPESGLWLEDRRYVPQNKNIKQTPRIGVDYAGSIWSQKPYRFVLE